MILRPRIVIADERICFVVAFATAETSTVASVQWKTSASMRATSLNVL